METVHLDTHIIVWLHNKRLDLLSKKAADALETALLVISPAVILELEYLHECNRIRIDGQSMIASLVEQMGLLVADDSFKAVIEEARRMNWTRDVFDRLIAAHAHLHKAPLITKDRLIRKHYKCLW